VRAPLKPIVLALLRRRDDEVERRARSFRIDGPEDRARVARLGDAFLGGYHAMLEAADLGSVAARGRSVDPHWRPFFFEGAAMGYLPRGRWDAACRVEVAERDLLAMDPAFRYLYYVGLGFWYGFRHPRRPARLADLTARVTPLHGPLCWDGLGFKLAFFGLDPARPARALGLLERCPAAVRRFAVQGFGRASFFVFMDDGAGFERIAALLPAASRADLEFGRALACAFTGIDRPDALHAHVTAAGDAATRADRLLGTAWALTARRTSDPGYFAECLSRAEPHVRTMLAALPDLCESARADAVDYADWQARTRAAVAAAR
jgi:hypothetical protein